MTDFSNLAAKRRAERSPVKQGDVIAVWFSCGAASAVAAKKTIELYGDIATIRVLNNPIKEEHEDNRRFLKDVEQWLGVEIEQVINPATPTTSCVEAWALENFMAGRWGASCTLHLKKRARQHWENNNPSDWLVLGYTAEEQKRSNKFISFQRDALLPILIDAGITKEDCFKILVEAGIDLPMMYKLGAPNANCIGCVKASSPTYWNWVRKNFPDQFAERVEQSRGYGKRLVIVKGERIFLDELDPQAKGRPLKSMKFECGGLFCENELT